MIQLARGVLPHLSLLKGEQRHQQHGLLSIKIIKLSMQDNSWVQAIHQQTRMTNHPLLRNCLPRKSRRGADKKNICSQRRAALQEPTWRGSVADTAICRIFTSCSCVTSQAEYCCVGCFPEGFLEVTNL